MYMFVQYHHEEVKIKKLKCVWHGHLFATTREKRLAADKRGSDSYDYVTYVFRL